MLKGFVNGSLVLQGATRRFFPLMTFIEDPSFSPSSYGTKAPKVLDEYMHLILNC